MEKEKRDQGKHKGHDKEHENNGKHKGHNKKHNDDVASGRPGGSHSHVSWIFQS